MGSDDHTIEVKRTRVPRLGFGTWLLDGGAAAEAVRDAIEIGYRQIDTARAYENEREVGRGIAGSGVPRDEIFLTTKVPYGDADPATVERDAEESRRTRRDRPPAEGRPDRRPALGAGLGRMNTLRVGG
jgi:diketogulonate reductase-like aldo/keto reductase